MRQVLGIPLALGYFAIFVLGGFLIACAIYVVFWVIVGSVLRALF
jgi:hypothetical protein